MLTQYHELKKTNINLLKENSKNKMVGGGTPTTPTGSHVSNYLNPVSNGTKIDSIGVVKNGVQMTQLSMINGGSDISMMKSSKTHMGESSISMEISLDLDTETEMSTVFK